MKRILIGALLACCLFGCSKEPERPVRKTCAAVKAAVRAIYRVENAVTNGLAKPKIRSIDVAGMSAADFRREMRAVAHPAEAHLWMPSEKSWILVEHAPGVRVSLAQAMESLANDEACVVSVPEAFASYAGTVSEILPAFQAKLEGEVLPEWFVPEEVAAIGWMDLANVEPDILKVVSDEIRSLRTVRREILKGNIIAHGVTDPKKMSDACDIWARAMLRNPNDPILLERIDNLEANAVAFLKSRKLIQAMKCLETIILIQPTNAKAVHNFGICLKKIGKTELSDKVLERAKVLQR